MKLMKVYQEVKLSKKIKIYFLLRGHSFEIKSLQVIIRQFFSLHIHQGSGYNIELIQTCQNKKENNNE